VRRMISRSDGAFSQRGMVRAEVLADIGQQALRPVSNRSRLKSLPSG
jgi:hypothetical protein